MPMLVVAFASRLGVQEISWQHADLCHFADADGGSAPEEYDRPVPRGGSWLVARGPWPVACGPVVVSRRRAACEERTAISMAKPSFRQSTNEREAEAR